MEIKNCVLTYDARTETVTIRHSRYNTILMKIKLESAATGTMERITPEQDCDNFWIGIKPADSVIFGDVLFDRKKLSIQQLDFCLK